MAEESIPLRLKALCPSNVHIDNILLDTMEAHWHTWARDALTPQDKALWSAEIHLMLWPHSRASALNHFLSSYSLGDVSWVHLTMGKVMFGAEFLKTRTAANAQAKWPRTDLAEWRPNFNGPTKHPAFTVNPFVQQTLTLLEGLKLRDGRPWLQDLGPPAKVNMPPRQSFFVSNPNPNCSPHLTPAAVTPASLAVDPSSSESATKELINNMKKDIGDLRGLIATQRQEYEVVKAANEEEISWVRWRIQDALDDAQKEMELMREAHKRDIAELSDKIEAMATPKQTGEEAAEHDERGFVLVNDE